MQQPFSYTHQTWKSCASSMTVDILRGGRRELIDNPGEGTSR